jgi:hypothetical protein
MINIQICKKEFVMSTQSNTPENTPQEKDSGKVKEDKKLWPREPLRPEDEKASAEIERHLWPEGEAEGEEEKKIWPREPLRAEDEKAKAEIERELWSEEENKEGKPKKKNE